MNQVGTLGLVNGLLVIPFSIIVGRLSLSYQDHTLMKWLVATGAFGTFLLFDFSDLFVSPLTSTYNAGHILAVSPPRYVAGYFITYLSVQTYVYCVISSLCLSHAPFQL